MALQLVRRHSLSSRQLAPPLASASGPPLIKRSIKQQSLRGWSETSPVSATDCHVDFCTKKIGGRSGECSPVEVHIATSIQIWKKYIAGSSASKQGAQNEFDTSKSKTGCSVSFASLFSYLKAEGCARLGEGSESGDSGTPATHRYSLVIVSHGLNFSKGPSLSCCFVGPIFPLSRSAFAILLFSSPKTISSIFWSLVLT